MNKLILGTVVAAVPVTLAALPPASFDLDRDVACVIPAEAMVYFEAPGLPDLCEQGLKHPLIKTILASPLGDLIRGEIGHPGFALGMLNVWAGRPVLPALAKLTSGGVAFGVLYSDGPQPGFCVVARGDAAEWSSVVEEAMTRVAEAQDLPKDRVVPPHRKIRGMDVWFLGDSGAFALRDGVFVGASDEDTLRRMIDLGAEEGTSGLASREDFRRARETYRSEDAFVWGWFDLESLEEALPEGMADLRNFPAEPGAQLVLGPSIANIAGSRAAVLEVRFGGDRIDLDVVGIDAPQGAAERLLAERGGRPPALPAPRGEETARGVLYRDLAGVFRERVELFSPQAQPGFAEATAGLALFFGGQDITDEILPTLDPWIGILSRPINFDERATPDVPLPGAVLLLRTTDPEVGLQLVQAVNSLITVLNLEAAQNQQPVMTVQLELHAGTTITYGRFRRPAEGEGVDLRYNLEPACALVGDTFVLGSHRILVEDVVEQLVAGDLAEPAPGEVLQFSGAEVARVIDANEETLVMGSVLNDGKTEEQARKEVRALHALASMIDVLKLETTRTAARDLRASLSLLLGGGE